MSAWDRSRYIPWTRIPDVSGPDYERSKEKVYRSLNKEANQEKESLNNNNATTTSNDAPKGISQVDGFTPPEVQDPLINNKKKGLFKGVEYNTPDLLRSVAFGACIGSITGATFGFMDGMRSAGESSIIKNASNMAKGKFLLQGTSRAGATFGVFFAGFHAVKYGIRVLCDPGVWYEMAGAGAISIGALSIRPNTRASVPYAGMLVGMDAFSNYMKETS